MFYFTGLSAMFDMDIYLRSPLSRVLSRMSISNAIGGGSEVVSEYFQLFPRDMACLVHPSCRRYPLLLAGFSITPLFC